jgi:hypothetical protein
MPLSGAIFLTNGKKKRKSSPHGRLVARFNRTNRRKNGLAVRTNRRKNGLAVRTNRRKNGLAVRTNGKKFSRRRNNGASVSAIFAPVQKAVSMIPGGKTIAPYVAPAAYGALGLLGVHFALKYGAKYIPAQIKSYVTPIGYTLAGLLLGVVVQFLPIASGDKKALATTMVVGGAGVDVFRKLTGTVTLGDDVGDDVGDELGEGGLWQLGDDVGDESFGDIALSDPEVGDIMGDYADAELGDAYYSGADLDSVEGEAALAGPRAWRRRFPKRRRATKVGGPCSRHAAQHGHRWGWLCRLIGFEKFRGVVALPAVQRVAYIAQLRKYAISSIPKAVPVAAIAATPVSDAVGDDLSGLGATLYSGAGAAF